MRFFLDSASAEEARRIKDLALLDGVWLSVAAAEAAGVEYRKAVRELASLTDGPVLVELSADDPKGMYKEARELAKLGKDIVVRLPLKPEGLRVARLLSEDSVAACAAGCHALVGYRDIHGFGESLIGKCATTAGRRRFSSPSCDGKCAGSGHIGAAHPGGSSQ